MKILYFISVLLLLAYNSIAQYAQLNGAPLNSNFNYPNTTPTILQGPGVEADVTVQLVMGNATIPANRLRVVFEFSNYQYWDVLNASQIVPPNNFVVASDYVDVATRVIVFTNNVTLTNHTEYFYFVIRGIAKAANPSFTGNVARLEENMLASGQMNFVISNASISNVLSIGSEPLPIEMGPLVGTKIDEDKTQLNWITYKEEGIQHFIIERSADGKLWKSLGTTPSVSKGASISIPQNYQFIDKTPLNGNNMYRIITTDNLNETHYTNIVSLFFNTSEVPIVVYPNPATNEIYVQHDKESKVQIINAHGQIIACKQSFIENRHVIDINQLPAGVYFINIIANNITKYVAFTKVNP